MMQFPYKSVFNPLDRRRNEPNLHTELFLRSQSQSSQTSYLSLDYSQGKSTGSLPRYSVPIQTQHFYNELYDLNNCPCDLPIMLINCVPVHDHYIFCSHLLIVNRPISFSPTFLSQSCVVLSFIKNLQICLDKAVNTKAHTHNVLLNVLQLYLCAQKNI